MLKALRLGLGRLWWEIPCLLLVLKPGGFVRSIAKRLVCGVAATAERKVCPTGEAIRLALHIDKLDFPFHAQGAVIADRDFCRRHLRSQMPDSSPRPGRGGHKKSEARIFSLVFRHPRIDFIRPGQDATLQVP